VWVLIHLDRIPDAARRTVPDDQEAWCIRRCGFFARAGGTWLCPPLPDRLVEHNPLLRHLSDRPDLSVNERRPSRWAREFQPFFELQIRLARTLNRAPSYCMTRRQLQKSFWRLRAPFFNYVLDSLLSEGRITECQGWLFPIAPEIFKPADWFNEEVDRLDGHVTQTALPAQQFPSEQAESR